MGIIRSEEFARLPVGFPINSFAYNFIKIHSTLRTSPAMAAGVTTRLFDVSDLIALLVEAESKEPHSTKV